jgi:hypothetical protein
MMLFIKIFCCFFIPLSIWTLYLLIKKDEDFGIIDNRKLPVRFKIKFKSWGYKTIKTIFKISVIIAVIITSINFWINLIRNG